MGMVKDDMDVFDSLIKYEDFAWVDSCLVEDPIIPPSGEWSCMKDALLEILGSASKTPSLLVDGRGIPLFKLSESGDRFKDKDDNDIYFCEEGESSQTMQHDDDDDNDKDEEVADVKDNGDYNTVWYKSAKAKGHIRKALRESSRDISFTANSGSRSGIGVLPASKEMDTPSDDIFEVWDLGINVEALQESSRDIFFTANSGSRSGIGLLPTSKEMDTPSDDIFKVWDLGINVEEDEFSKQMNKLLADNEDGSYLRDRSDRVMNESVDSLVYGIADLSLEQA